MARKKKKIKSPLFMPVFTASAPVLRNKSEVIKEITPDIIKLTERMIATMFENDLPGIGLAAPQVGENKRLIVLGIYENVNDLPEDALPGDKFLAAKMPLALINPEILSNSAETDSMEEGCLSLPGVNGIVIRPTTITIKTQFLNGESAILTCSGLTARCLQHEIDHLDGILFIDRVEKVAK